MTDTATEATEAPETEAPAKPARPSSSAPVTPRLKQRYRDEIVPALLQTLLYGVAGAAATTLVGTRVSAAPEKR